jgi:thermostable 8-oxoguanine DNA glycosylase
MILTEQEKREIVNNLQLNVGDWSRNGMSVANAIEAAVLAKLASRQQLLSASEVEQILARWSYEIHGDRARYIVRETEATHSIKEKP